MEINVAERVGLQMLDDMGAAGLFARLSSAAWHHVITAAPRGHMITSIKLIRRYSQSVPLILGGGPDVREFVSVFDVEYAPLPERVNGPGGFAPLEKRHDDA